MSRATSCIAFLISAFYAALAGSLFVHAVGFVSPEVYGLHMVVLAFTMLYVGGIGTVAGAALGALVIALLPETVRRFSEYQDLAYGALLILILIYAPRRARRRSRACGRASRARRAHEPPAPRERHAAASAASSRCDASASTSRPAA